MWKLTKCKTQLDRCNYWHLLGLSLGSGTGLGIWKPGQFWRLWRIFSQGYFSLFSSGEWWERIGELALHQKEHCNTKSLGISGEIRSRMLRPKNKLLPAQNLPAYCCYCLKQIRDALEGYISWINFKNYLMHMVWEWWDTTTKLSSRCALRTIQISFSMEWLPGRTVKNVYSLPV